MPESYFLEMMEKIHIAEGVVLLRNAVDTATLRNLIDGIAAQSPFRQMAVKGGKLMSAFMTNCGEVGWTSSEYGYRYLASDPLTQQAWPAMPDEFRSLAKRSAALAGFKQFEPDICLINRYTGKAQMGSHQDRDERGLHQPVVSVSIGSDAIFKLGGLQRSDPMEKLLLSDGDILIWGGVSRLRFHSVSAILPTLNDPLQMRLNMTFRRAL